MKNISRRNFLSCSAALGGGALLASTPLLSSCSAKSGKMTPLKQPGEYYIPELPDKAIDGRELKCGLVGCGGRGMGAAMNVVEAANGVKITALGDLFPDRLSDTRAYLKETTSQDIADDMCFIGFDAYKKVIDSGIDMVILATPPVFRPYYFQYAVEKGVHAFLEKPVAVDAAGYRTIMAAAKVAQSKGLSVVTGTQRHHQREYVEAFELVQKGMIGEITGGEVYWNQDMLWYRDRKPEWSDMEWSVRDWVNWRWLSGDHIVEQHVHNIDVFLWFAGIRPISAKAVGARHRRVTGDQYDCFSVDFEFENGIHLHSMSRQINGCSSSVGEVIQGTKGQWSSFDNTIRDLQGNILWQFDAKAAEAKFTQHNPYTLEHVDWVNHIRKNEAHDEATPTAISTLAGILGREAAYTGNTVTWDEIAASDMNYLPGDVNSLEFGDLDAVKNPVIPVPGN